MRRCIRQENVVFTEEDCLVKNDQQFELVYDECIGSGERKIEKVLLQKSMSII